MKHLSNYSIMLVAILSMCSLMYSCSQEDELSGEITAASQREKIADGISITNGYVDFESVDAFEHLIGEEDKDIKLNIMERLRKTSKFTSWYNFYSSDSDKGIINGRTEAEQVLLEDEFLSSVMNEDGILKIGNHWFKINMNQERVLALHEDDATHYSDLVNLVNEATENQTIMIFSTNDEVLTLLEEGSKGTIKNGKTAGLFCKDSQASSKDSDQTVYYGAGNDYRMLCNVEYFKFGVYFKLMAKVRNQSKGPGGIWIAQEGIMRIDYDTGYKPRCRSTSYKSGSTDAIDNSEKRVVYEAAKGLNKYYYRAQFFNDAFGGVAVSDIIEIRDGM